ncbi:MAG: HAD family hydrolase [Verrucomicrobiota bacterium]|nr:haloacid dehalogenase-like hydrolase [Limisphaera sp.]MDW8382511.1 HAD family hydrolase [Verrucomicrobiota bacterium]
MVRLILFDIDGTLIRTAGAGVGAFIQALADEFGIRDGMDRLRFAGRTDTSLVREILHAHSIHATTEHLQRFFDRYVFLLEERLQRLGGEILPGVLSFLDGLQQLRPVPVVGLLTGNIRLGAEIKLRHFGLWDRFQIGAFADDAEDRAVIAALARRRGERRLGHPLHDNEILVVGDTPHDIECARAIGARILAVATGEFGLDDLRLHRPCWLVQNLGEIAPELVCA